MSLDIYKTLVILAMKYFSYILYYIPKLYIIKFETRVKLIAVFEMEIQKSLSLKIAFNPYQFAPSRFLVFS